ncbi:hypothetical protein QE152_g33436 [Popillia japonica]|uniref:Transposase n=1 Tax=Popillia japonica TaxID=7064 RepID=A0AAW1IXB4_POPJA
MELRWKLQAQAILTRNGLWNYVSGKTLRPTTEGSELEKWDQEDLNAKSELILISPGELKQIKNYISVREAEGINKSRAIVTEEFIRTWFRDLSKFLESKNCKDIMDNPQRIFNGDESGFALCPKTGKVLAQRGWKNSYQIKPGNDKENITVLIVFNADGNTCPPLVIFPYIRPPSQKTVMPL